MSVVFNLSMKSMHLGLIGERVLKDPTAIIIISGWSSTTLGLMIDWSALASSLACVITSASLWVRNWSALLLSWQEIILRWSVQPDGVAAAWGAGAKFTTRRWCACIVTNVQEAISCSISFNCCCFFVCFLCQPVCCELGCTQISQSLGAYLQPVSLSLCLTPPHPPVSMPVCLYPSTCPPLHHTHKHPPSQLSASRTNPPYYVTGKERLWHMLPIAFGRV